MTVQGKTVMITGASRGIGEAAAREFAAAGANVVLLARSTADIERVAGEIGKAAIALSCDVSRMGDVDAAITGAARAFGGVDILINNAAVIGPTGHLAETDPSGFSDAIDINLKGVFHAMHAVLPGMVAKGSGTIINISSGAATNPVEFWTSYCASKAAVLMLTRMGDREYADRGIRVMGLSPGTVATDMQRAIKATGLGSVAKLNWSDHIPPEWPAKTLVWMCGPEADGWLGQDISLRDDGIRRAVGLIE